MDTLIILLGVLGFGATIIAVHVFSADSGAYVGALARDEDDFNERTRLERRSGVEVIFPLLINDTVVHEERRHLPDRRQAAA